MVKWIINICSIVMTDCAVPMFFVISGYLFFLKKSKLSSLEYKKKINGKLITLMLPYLIWNLLGIVANPGVFFDASFTDKLLGVFWSRDFMWRGVSGPWDGPLWFIRDLFVVMLFSPLLSLAIRKSGLVLPIILTIPYLFKFEAVCPGLSTVSFLFFSLGSWLAICKPKLHISHNATKGIIVLLTVAFSMARISIMAGIFKSDDALINIIVSLILFGWILLSMTTYYMIAQYVGDNTKNFSFWKKLGASSFVIFAMHSLINGRISSALLHIAGKDNVGSGLTICFYLLTISLTVVICYGTHMLIRRNKTASLLLEGGRSR